MPEATTESGQRYVSWATIAEEICASNDISGQDLAAFVGTNLVRGWLKAYVRKVDNLELYPASIGEFIGRAFYLVQLGADLNLLELMVNRPYLVIALVSGMVDAVVTMDEETEDE